MKISGAQIVIETLIEQGTEVLFGYPGGQVLNIYDALYLSSDRINHIITAHEQGAVHAADGYARTTGRVGVVLATSGPGATNLVTGIANAYLDSIPLVAITGNVPCAIIGRDSFQEVDITGITMPITKHNYMVKDVSILADTIREAFAIAKSGRPGPVLIDIPKDVQIATYEFENKGVVPAEPYLAYQEEIVEQAVQVLAAAKRPYIYCGGGVIASDASKEIAELAERLDSPIGMSLMGISAVPCESPRNLGMAGMHGHYASSKAKANADVIVAVGVRFSDRATGNKSKYATTTKIIHIDIDPAEIDKNISVDLGITGNIKDVLQAILNRLPKQTHPEWEKQIAQYRSVEVKSSPCPDGLTPYKIIDAVSNYTDAETVIATDVGQHQMWVAQYYNFKIPRTFVTSGGLGTMGFGMGAAIGSAVGKNGKKTVLFTGDGSFGMNLNEMATAVSQNLPLVIVIMNNGVLGMVRQWQTLFFNQHYSSTTLGRKTDFSKLADAFGAIGYRVTTAQELEEAMKNAWQQSGPVIIDCVIGCDEQVLPMMPPGGSYDDIIIKTPDKV